MGILPNKKKGTDPQKAHSTIGTKKIRIEQKIKEESQAESYIKYLLSANYMPDAILGTRIPWRAKKQKTVLTELIFQYVCVWWQGES